MEVLLNSYKGVLDRIDSDEAVKLRMLMPNPDDERFLFLRYIDPYDDTVFNSFQMAPIISELDILLSQYQSETDRSVVEHLRSMAVRCQEETGRHLRFIGD